MNLWHLGLIEEVLRHVCRLIACAPELVLRQTGDDPTAARAKRLRRRGLRQAWLLRGIYRGHPVPDQAST